MPLIAIPTGAVVLCGGQSQRMGYSKALLPFDHETMLARVVRLVSEVAPLQNIVVVAAAAQQLPVLPAGVRVIRDLESDQGPLPAVVAGLEFLHSAGVVAAFITACDSPLLQPALARMLLDKLKVQADRDCSSPHAVVPDVGERLHPLTAAYSCSCSMALKAVLDGTADSGEGRSLHAALRSGLIRLHTVSADELSAVDPQLQSLQSCNTFEEYRRALAAAR